MIQGSQKAFVIKLHIKNICAIGLYIGKNYTHQQKLFVFFLHCSIFLALNSLFILQFYFFIVFVYFLLCHFFFPIKGHTDYVLGVAFDQNGLLASGSVDSTIKLWDTITGQLMNTLEGHSSYVWSLAFDKNGLLASGSLDNTIKLWNTTTGQLKNTLEGKSA